MKMPAIDEYMRVECGCNEKFEPKKTNVECE